MGYNGNNEFYNIHKRVAGINIVFVAPDAYMPQGAVTRERGTSKRHRWQIRVGHFDSHAMLPSREEVNFILAALESAEIRENNYSAMHEFISRAIREFRHTKN